MSEMFLSPVELEVARNRLESISEEVGFALIRTSYSPNIKDRRDCSAGIYMPDGELISQAEHIPLHLGLMPTLIANALEEFGAENIRPGDVLMTNNPYLGGSHLPDLCVISPIFIDNEFVAVVANMAHHVDVGGISPGSMSSYATEIFQEGVRVPTVRLYSEGVLQHDVLNLMLTNLRTREKTRGDLMAQVAANKLGELRIGELVAEWGIPGFQRSCRALIDYAERRTRHAISQLPDGDGSFTDYLEHDGTAPAELPIVAKVKVSGDEIEVDLTETVDAAKGAVNCSYAVASSCVAYAVKSLADPSLPSNAGLMAPITVKTRPGSLVSAEFPSPVANGNTQTSQRIVDAIYGAFNRFADGLVPAASSGSMSILTIGGLDTDTGDYYSYVETYGGGQGGMPGFSGASAVHTHMTNTRNTPCEVIEREYPLRVNRYQIADNTGGRGEYAGGDGLIRELTLTRGTATVVAGTSRTQEGPWGLAGGGSGEVARSEIITEEGTIGQESMSRFELTAGQGVRLQTAGGGGYGSAQ